MMQELKISRDVINLCQNHVVGSKVDRSYLHYDFKDEKREAWIKLGNRIESILNIINLCSTKGFLQGYIIRMVVINLKIC